MLDRLPAYIRPTIFLSIITGLVFGVLLLIPVVQLIMIFAFWFVGGIIVYLLKKHEFVGQFSQNEGIIIGCVSGMLSVVAASITFLPLSVLIGAIFKTANIGFLFSTSFTSSVFSFFVLFLFVFFIGLVNIIFNLASALGMIALYNNLLENNKEEKEEFKIEL